MLFGFCVVSLEEITSRENAKGPLSASFHQHRLPGWRSPGAHGRRRRTISVRTAHHKAAQSATAPCSKGQMAQTRRLEGRGGSAERSDIRHLESNCTEAGKLHPTQLT